MRPKFSPDDICRQGVPADRYVWRLDTCLSIRSRSHGREHRTDKARKVKTGTYLRPKQRWCRRRGTADRLARWVSASPNLLLPAPSRCYCCSCTFSRIRCTRGGDRRGWASTTWFRHALIGPTARDPRAFTFRGAKFDSRRRGFPVGTYSGIPEAPWSVSVVASHCSHSRNQSDHFDNEYSRDADGEGLSCECPRRRGYPRPTSDRRKELSP